MLNVVSLDQGVKNWEALFDIQHFVVSSSKNTCYLNLLSGFSAVDVVS